MGGCGSKNLLQNPRGVRELTRVVFTILHMIHCIPTLELYNSYVSAHISLVVIFSCIAHVPM